jgi:phosphoribosylamine---glycine ligase
MKKILLIGNGAREHVLSETFMRSRHDVEIFTFGSAKNPGIMSQSTDYLVGNPCDLDLIREYALRIKPDFAFIGPENPIEVGVVDMLLDLGIKSASPLQTVGRLESSKSFSRDLLENYGIKGNPRFKVFYNDEGLYDFLKELESGFVVKADGLKGGKGVKVSGDHLNSVEDGLAFARECISDVGKVVVEEKLVGQEFSLMSFCDGINTVEMPAVQDHKRAYEGDKGPNTGGMGTYSDSNHSLPFLNSVDLEEAADITKKVANALFQETGTYFKGVMYGGFMSTASGVRLIEYNARFGDPEAMNVLPLLKTDFVDLCEAIIHGDLKNSEVEFEKKATVCKYLVPDGYPDNPLKDVRIKVGEEVAGVKRYFASVDERDDGLFLGGSRAIAMVGIADSLEEAEKLAERGASSVKGPVFYRKDIGTASVIQQKIAMMKELRG